MFKNFTKTIVFLTVMLFGSTVFAFNGDWTETFTLKDGVTKVDHTPDYVSMGGMQGRSSMKFNSKVFNSMTMAAPLELKTDSTREEFVAALRASGLYS